MTMASASARSGCWARRFSARMMPALLMSTLRAGKSAATWAAKARMRGGVVDVEGEGLHAGVGGGGFVEGAAGGGRR